MGLTVGTRLGTLRAYWLSMAVMIGGFMAGYDSGVAGGVLTFKSFLADYHYKKTGSKKVNAFTVGFQQLGSFVACFLIFPFMSRFGRRLSIQLACVVFLIGVIIETVNTHSLSAWYVGRVIAGLGQGALCVVVPTYSAEMAPKEIRGRLGSLYQWQYTLGIFMSYWVDYGTQHNISNSLSRQWQIPVALQLVSAGILFLSMFTLKESTRWLLRKGREAEAWQSLTWIRADSSSLVREEFEEMVHGNKQEAELRKGVGYRELLTPANRKRFMQGALVFLFQQGTGSTALAWYGPQFFQQLVGEGEKDLLITGLFGAVKVVACTAFILLLAEAFGRRILMTAGAATMGTCMLITAIVVKYKPPPKGDSNDVTSAGAATVALIFINIAAYNCSWGPIPWAYTPELFPNRIREIGMASSVAVHWLFSFTFTIATPYMQASMGWGIFLFYFFFDMAMIPFTLLTFKETRNKSLERVDAEYEGTAKPGRAVDDAASKSSGSGDESGNDARVDVVPAK